MSSADRLAHLPALDGLRGVAILLVLAHNFHILSRPQGVPGRLVEVAMDSGWVGVQLFFVLSGYLITRILLATQSSPEYYRAFYVRRVLRIFPLYYATLLLVTVVLPALSLIPPPAEGGGLWLWLFLSNWTSHTFGSGGMPHFWSLAVEEQFYLVWPLLVRHLNARGVLRMCIALAAASLAWRLGMLALQASPEHLYVWTPCRLDALGLGAAVAAWMEMPHPPQKLARMARLAGRAALALCLAWLLMQRGYPRTGLLAQSLGYTVLAIGFAGLILALVARAAATAAEPVVSGPLSHGLLRSVGRYSYGMYLFHKPLHDHLGLPLLATWGQADTASVALALAYFAGASLGTYALAAVSYHTFERHFLALKRHFPNQAGPAEAQREAAGAAAR